MTSTSDRASAHESRCDRCGICCYAAIEIPDGRQVVIENARCQLLRVPSEVDSSGGSTCAIYETRLQRASWCHHTDVAGPMGLLRRDCPYYANPKGKVRLSKEEYEVVLPSIVGLLLMQPAVNPQFTYKAFFDDLKIRNPMLYRRVAERALVHVGEKPWWVFWL